MNAYRFKGHFWCGKFQERVTAVLISIFLLNLGMPAWSKVQYDQGLLELNDMRVELIRDRNLFAENGTLPLNDYNKLLATTGYNNMSFLDAYKMVCRREKFPFRVDFHDKGFYEKVKELGRSCFLEPLPDDPNDPDNIGRRSRGYRYMTFYASMFYWFHEQIRADKVITKGEIRTFIQASQIAEDVKEIWFGANEKEVMTKPFSDIGSQISHKQKEEI